MWQENGMFGAGGYTEVTLYLGRTLENMSYVKKRDKHGPSVFTYIPAARCQKLDISLQA